jgi:hypothetical protein
MAGWVVLNSQNRPRRARAAALGAVAVAIGLSVAARLIVTDRERMAETTVELVRATATVDLPTLEELLARDCIAMTAAPFAGVPFGRDGVDRATLLGYVQGYLGGNYRVAEYGVLETQVQFNGPTSARTQVRVRATSEKFGTPLISWWRIDWRKTTGGWKAVLIELLEMEDFRGFLRG